MSEDMYYALTAAALLLIIPTIVSWIVFLILLLSKLFKGKRRFPRYSFLTSVLSTTLILLFFYNHFYNISFLPKGELNEVALSPNGRYEIHSYHYTSLFARKASARLIDTQTNKARMIYFNDFDYAPLIKWENDAVVHIGREKLNVLNGESYDFRDDKIRERKQPPQARTLKIDWLN